VKSATGIWPVFASEAALDVDGELPLAAEAELDADDGPQAIVSKASNDAIAAARFIGVTSCNGRGLGRLQERHELRARLQAAYPPLEERSPAFVLDATHAWVAESGAGAAYGASLYTATFRTTDGGKTWDEGASIEGVSPKLFFIDQDHGWLLLPPQGSSATDSTATLYSTNDAGLHWNRVLRFRPFQHRPPARPPDGPALVRHNAKEPRSRLVTLS